MCFVFLLEYLPFLTNEVLISIKMSLWHFIIYQFPRNGKISLKNLRPKRKSMLNSTIKLDYSFLLFYNYLKNKDTLDSNYVRFIIWIIPSKSLIILKLSMYTDKEPILAKIIYRNYDVWHVFLDMMKKWKQGQYSYEKYFLLSLRNGYFTHNFTFSNLVKKTLNFLLVLSLLYVVEIKISFQNFSDSYIILILIRRIVLVNGISSWIWSCLLGSSEIVSSTT